jgi:RNA polymerase sigma-70 factor (ECF subfamily)
VVSGDEGEDGDMAAAGTDGQEQLARRFEEHRGHLRSVAYRMLGSLAEADDAVQEAWLRLSRSDVEEVRNLGGWLTTVVARVALTMLRSRSVRAEQPLDWQVPDPVVTGLGTGSGAAIGAGPASGAGAGVAGGADPEGEAVVADSVGLALLVVLDSLAPAERLAFVLHDLFGMPFEEIAPVVDRSPAAARQLASRARRRVRSSAPDPERDPARQRRVVDAFLAASREGDFDALVAVLAPDVVLRADSGPPVPGAPATPGTSKLLRGAAAVAGQAVLFARFARDTRPALVNGSPGLVSTPGGVLTAVMAFVVADGLIVEIDVLADPARLSRLAPEASGPVA